MVKAGKRIPPGLAKKSADQLPEGNLGEAPRGPRTGKPPTKAKESEDAEEGRGCQGNPRSRLKNDEMQMLMVMIMLTSCPNRFSSQKAAASARSG